MVEMRRQGKYTKRVTPSQHVKRQVKKRFRWWRKLSWKKRILVVGVPIFAFLVLTPILTYLYFAQDISDMNRLMNRNNTGIVLYADDGKTPIYTEGKAVHQDLTPLTGISTDMQHALIASEDKDFYQNKGGVSILGTLRAVYGYVINGGGSFGGSTITEQLAKITLLSSNRSFLRQFQALSIAVAIENTYTKDQILDMYLNSVYFGENSFGIQDAAQTYFGTTPDKLDLAQSAMLIGVLPAPTIYSPISGNATYAKERQDTVLSRMVANGYITDAQKTAAEAENLTYQPPQSPINNSVAPHFAQMVLDQLYQKYGEETVERSGYQVTTTLDANVQNQLNAAVAGNLKTINYYGGHNAAAVAIDPTDGEVRGLVGSYDWNDPNYGKVNVITSERQPGSSFKPIYYSQALANGTITPATVLKDEPTDFGGGYEPLDADHKFRGNVTVRQALDESLNIPSVEVMQKVGISNAISDAQKEGITSIDPNDNYGLSLALGSAEVTPLQMTNAYAAFANQGKQYNNTIIKTIDNKYSEQVYKASETSKQVISQQGAFLISNILSDNAARTPIFGNTLTVYDGKTRAVKTVAVKTGTTNDDRDAWAIGYTPQLAIGAWVGNNDNTVMQNGGSIMAGPIFTKAMGNILAGVDTSFPTPSGVVQKNVCTSNHGLADSAVKGQTYTEWFLDTALPPATCSSTATPSPTPTPTSTTDNPGVISMTLSASPANSATQGTNVTFTATMSDDTAEGIVTFYDGSQSIGSSTLINGSASLITPSLSAGTHEITATFQPTDTSQYDPVSASLTYQITSSGKGFPF
jgi:penicillin-binding protein 1C